MGEAVDTKKSKGGPKMPKEKDFGGPGRPRSGYFIFADEHRDASQKEARATAEKSGEKFSIAMVGKLTASKWSALGEEGQQTYNDRAVQEKEENAKKSAAWKLTDGYKDFLKATEEAKTASIAKEAPKDTDFGKPTRVQSAYFLFANDVREATTKEVRAECDKNGTKFAVGLVGKAVAVKWNAVPEAKKAEYQAKVDAAKAQYEADVAAWEKTPQYEEFIQAQLKHKQKVAKNESSKIFALEGCPKKNMTAYAIFADNYRAEYEKRGQQLGPKQLTRVVKEEWEKLDAEKKAEWEAKAAADEERFEREMKAFEKTDEYKSAAKGYKKAEKAVAAKKEEKSALMKSGSKKRKGNDGEAVDPTSSTDSVAP